MRCEAAGEPEPTYDLLERKENKTQGKIGGGGSARQTWTREVIRGMPVVSATNVDASSDQRDARKRQGRYRSLTWQNLKQIFRILGEVGT